MNLRSASCMRSFSHQAATFSVLAPLVAVGIGIGATAARQSLDPDLARLSATVVGVANGLIIVLGLLFGIIALCGIFKQGAQGILTTALAGVVVNSVLILFAATGFVRARELSAQRTGDKSSEVVTRLCQHIVQNRQKMIVDTNQTETVWSDGAMLEFGTSFPKGLQELIDRPSAHHDIRSFVKKLDPGDSSTWKKASLSPFSPRDRYATIASLDGKIHTRVERLYLDYLAQRYPTASIRIKGQFEPIIFLVGGEVQASVMPVKL